MGFFDRFFVKARTPEAQRPSLTLAYQSKAARIADIEAAIIAHQNWRINFNAYLAGHVKNLSPEHLSCDNQCVLGKWLYGIGQERYGQSAIFTEIIEAHKQFHEETAKVFKWYQENNREVADQHLATECAKLSDKLQTRLNDLKSMA